MTLITWLEVLTCKKSYPAEAHLQPTVYILGVLFLWSVLEQILAKVLRHHSWPSIKHKLILSLVGELGKGLRLSKLAGVQRDLSVTGP